MAAAAKKTEVIVEEPEVIVEEPETSVDTPDELDIPEGGIGGFAMSEEDFAVLEAEEAKKEFGEEGLAQFTAVAKKMAGHGRFGDDSVAHIQTGEMVVPLTLLESNPALKAQIFKQLRASGIEDPEQYVVGSKANSINPETGLMEFGWFSKLWKGIKKIVKTVVKVIKKVAPIILPIALAFTPLGAVYGAAMGSGIGTLINGGSIKDALKSALISGATAGVMKGISGTMSGEGFLETVGAELKAPLGRVSQTVSGAGTSLGNVFGSEATQLANVGKPTFFSDYIAPGAISEAVTATTQGGDAATQGGDAAVSDSINLEKPPGFTESVKGALTPGDDVGFFEGMKDAFMPATGTVELNVGNQAYNDAFNNAMTLKEMTVEGAREAGQIAQSAAIDAATKAVTPGLIRKFGPSALAGTALAAGAGFFKVPEQEMPGLVGRNEDGTVITGADLVAADPTKYLVHDLGATRLNPETGEYEEVEDEYTVEAPDTSMYTVPTNYPFPSGQQSVISPNGYLMASNPGGPFARPYVQGAAEGGPIYPRHKGGVAPGEGVQGQDSVRAMLMPGEFVMTADAVRGLGNGSLNNGIKSMYSVMRNLESRGRATA